MEAKTSTNSSDDGGIHNNREILDDNSVDDLSDVLMSSNRVANSRISEIKHYRAVPTRSDLTLKTFEFQRNSHLGQIAVGRYGWDGDSESRSFVNGVEESEDAKSSGNDDIVVAPHMVDPEPKKSLKENDRSQEQSDSKRVRFDSNVDVKHGSGHRRVHRVDDWK